MARKKLNTRCPLQEECERKCEYEHRELDCDYYYANALGDSTIADQEARRREIERKREAEAFEAELSAVDSVGDVDGEETPAPGGGSEPEKGQLVNIHIDYLHPHPDNPRKDLGDLTELADSIKANGVLQNLTIVPNVVLGEISKEYWQRGYKVVIGHRRLAAAKMAGLKELPCVIKEMSDQEQIRTMLMENIQRADLTVYEQAQGFQMMLDLGDTVEGVAQKTGFSETTVRRRTKLLELDQEKFKKSEARGANLFDYMELDKIKSVERKNEVLEHIGTDNFKYKLRQAIDAEEREARLEKWEAALRVFAIKIESDKGYRQVRYYYASGEPNIECPEDADSVDYFFTADRYGAFRLLKKESDMPQPKEDPEQAKKQEQMERRRNLLAEATARAYRLRSEFTLDVSATKIKKNLTDIVAAALWCGFSFYVADLDEDEILELLDLATEDEDGENEDESPELTYEDFFTQVEKGPERVLWRMLYQQFGDDEHERYYEPYSLKYRKNERLDMVYAILEKLGYGMSDEEKALRDGTHELFHRDEPDKDDEEEADPCTLCKSAHPSCDECCATCEDTCNSGQTCRKQTED